MICGYVREYVRSKIWINLVTYPKGVSLQKTRAERKGHEKSVVWTRVISTRRMVILSQGKGVEQGSNVTPPFCLKNRKLIILSAGWLGRTLSNWGLIIQGTAGETIFFLISIAPRAVMWPHTASCWMDTLGSCPGVKAVEARSWRLPSVTKLRITGVENSTPMMAFKAWTGTNWSSVEFAVFLDIMPTGVSEFYRGYAIVPCRWRHLIRLKY